jgi:predicted dinucleotide-binding enzyme
MRVGVVGTGTMGRAIGSLVARHGHQVVFGSRNPAGAAELVKDLGTAEAMPYRLAALTTDLTFFCVDWQHAQGALALLGDCAGRVLIDVSNPETADGRSLILGHTTSGAEQIAQVSRARVVKAFNHIYAEMLSNPSALAGLAPTVLLCGDDADAKSLTTELVRSCELDTLDCGPLRVARHLEPLAMLMVQVVREQGFDPAGIALRLERGAGAEDIYSRWARSISSK